MANENSTSQFKGKTAIISGGAEGIGLSIAKALGEQQMNVVLADIDDKNLQKRAGRARVTRCSGAGGVSRCGR